MPKGNQSYTKEFKQEAVRLVQTSETPAAKIAANLGIPESNLSRWCSQAKAQGTDAFPGSGHLLPQEEQIRQLQRELERTRMERDILKKAVAIFSRPVL